MVVKGWEHRERFNVEQGFLESSGGKLVFSQDNIRLDEITAKTGSKVNLNLNSTPFEEFSERRSIATSDLSKIVQKFEDLRVCVVGDLIVDQYVNCSPVGMSREDPTIVRGQTIVKFMSEELVLLPGMHVHSVRKLTFSLLQAVTNFTS